jgi:hypothetical protein
MITILQLNDIRVAPEGSKAHSRWKLYEEQRRLLKEYSELNTSLNAVIPHDH